MCVFSTHSTHMWALDNPHRIKPGVAQHPQKLLVCDCFVEVRDGKPMAHIPLG